VYHHRGLTGVLDDVIGAAIGLDYQVVRVRVREAQICKSVGGGAWVKGDGGECVYGRSESYLPSSRWYRSRRSRLWMWPRASTSARMRLSAVNYWGKGLTIALRSACTPSPACSTDRITCVLHQPSHQTDSRHSTRGSGLTAVRRTVVDCPSECRIDTTLRTASWLALRMLRWSYRGYGLPKVGRLPIRGKRQVRASQVSKIRHDDSPLGGKPLPPVHER
jgi:hypothetical protein